MLRAAGPALCGAGGHTLNTEKRKPKTDPPLLLIFSQTFAPDPAAVGQYMADVAVTLAGRGYRVRVYAAQRGYDDNRRRYPRRENMQGADIRRLAWCSFGKRKMALRLFGTASFLLQCFCIGLLTRRVGGIFFSTSPPLIGFTAAWLHKLRGIPVAYWAMDLNPDQLIAMGLLRPGGWQARWLERMNRFILKQAVVIFVLDRFMARRLCERGAGAGRMQVAPPWSRETPTAAPPRPNAFRAQWGLQDKFIFMYSGNHSPANPLGTLLAAAEQFTDDPQVSFVFIGAGLAKPEVDEVIRRKHLMNVLSLPWQPREHLAEVHAAADVHVVSLGEKLTGVVHPCKVYSALAAGRPVLFLGPTPSHVSDLLAAHPIGWQVRHGQVGSLVELIRQIRATPPERLAEMGRQGRQLLQERFPPELLREQLCSALATALRLEKAARPN